MLISYSTIPVLRPECLLQGTGRSLQVGHIFPTTGGFGPFRQVQAGFGDF